MGKRKTRLSLFSTIAQKINENERKLPSSDCHLIDNEYFTAFNSLDDIQEFHAKVTEQQQKSSVDEETDVQNEHEDQDMDMKSFAQQFLLDSPETEDLSLIRTSSQEIFTTDQPINWSPRTNVNKNLIQSSGKFAL